MIRVLCSENMLSRLQIWLPILILGTSWVATAASPPSETAVEVDGSETAEDAAADWRRTQRPVPSDEVLEARGAVFGDILVVVEDIFDPDKPGENNRVYQVSNRLHRTTRDSVILRQLLFREGDPYSRQVIEESERILRENRYLFDAKIHAVDYRGNRVDVVVETRDVWTLKPGFSVGRSGGVSTSMFKLQDQNFLGFGKALTFKQGSDIDRDVLVLRYEDGNVLGSRVRMYVEYSDLSDGSRKLLDLRQPFYSLDSHWGAGLRFLTDGRIDSHYLLGERVAEFRHYETDVVVEGGLSRGLVDGRVRRWSAGVTIEEHEFSEVDYGDRDHVGPPPPDVLPGDRRFVYPWIAFSSIADRYMEGRDLDQIGRTEDLPLGGRYRFQLGYASEAFGSTQDALVFAARVDAGFRPAPGRTVLLRAGATGRYSSAGAEDVRLSGRGRFYWRDFGQHLLFLNVEVDAVHQLDPEDQLLLGGDTGLRGYPLRYQDGDKRFLLTLEQRFFTNFYPFRLAYIGAAVFFDVGRTWGDTEGFDQGLLKNVGVGARLSSSRSGLGSVVHFDVALPLDGDPSLEKVQWLVTTKASF